MLHSFRLGTYRVYFCTITCYKWLPLIQETNTYSSIYRWFDCLKNDGCKIVGYVLMPNHFHVLLYPTHSGTSLNQMIGDCKRFMAYEIVSSLREQRKTELLAILKKGVPLNEKRKGKIHQVFKPSFDVRECVDERMVMQKLDYIHHNPVRGKWALCDDFTLYEHSSACYYELNATSSVAITHYNDL